MSIKGKKPTAKKKSKKNSNTIPIFLLFELTKIFPPKKELNTLRYSVQNFYLTIDLTKLKPFLAPHVTT